MGMIKHMTAPIRGIVRFPLFQLAIVVGSVRLIVCERFVGNLMKGTHNAYQT